MVLEEINYILFVLQNILLRDFTEKNIPKNVKYYIVKIISSNVDFPNEIYNNPNTKVYIYHGTDFLNFRYSTIDIINNGIYEKFYDENFFMVSRHIFNEYYDIILESYYDLNYDVGDDKTYKYYSYNGKIQNYSLDNDYKFNIVPVLYEKHRFFIHNDNIIQIWYKEMAI